jgi:hypothetical protein
MTNKLLLQLIKWKKQASFSIRNLKRSTIKDFYAKEEQKRKNNTHNTTQHSSNSNHHVNTFHTPTKENQLKPWQNTESKP